MDCTDFGCPLQERFLSQLAAKAFSHFSVMSLNCDLFTVVTHDSGCEVGLNTSSAIDV